MQMSNGASRRAISNCHLCICACSFALFGPCVIDSRFLCLCVQACSISRRTSRACLQPATSGDGGRGVGERKGIKVLFPAPLMASGVSARSPSARPHLLRTKRGLVGVGTTEQHSKGIGQGDSSPAPCCAPLHWKKEIIFLPLCLPSYPCLSSQKRNSLRHETAEHLK